KEGSGTITETTGIKAGADHTVSFAPAEGYRLTRVEIDGIKNADALTRGSVTFKNIQKNHRVRVVYERVKDPADPENPEDKTHFVRVILEGGIGTVSESGSVNAGQDYTVKFHPGDGYVTGSIWINGIEHKELLDAASYTFTNITNDQEIRITFVKKDQSGSSVGPNPIEPPGSDQDNLLKSEVNKKPITLSSFSPY
ncbi:MAG: hypothetical protein RR614_13790, partial [Eubacterium sp.]